jgi:hypothetical protein
MAVAAQNSKSRQSKRRAAALVRRVEKTGVGGTARLVTRLSLRLPIATEVLYDRVDGKFQTKTSAVEFEERELAR